MRNGVEREDMDLEYELLGRITMSVVNIVGLFILVMGATYVTHKYLLDDVVDLLKKPGHFT